MFTSNPASDLNRPEGGPMPACRAGDDGRAVSAPTPSTTKALRGALSPFWVTAGALLWALTSLSATAQSATGPELPDPKKCVVVVDVAADVGLWIADAQAAHEVLMVSLRKRLGSDAVVYEGMRKSADQMKRLLGSSAETTIQDAQLAYFDAAEKSARWRVRVRFGSKKGEHFVTATCRKAADSPDHPLDTRTGSGKNFLQAKDALAKDIATFCAALAPIAAQDLVLPIEGAGGIPADPIGLHKKKPLKPWSPPPRRE